MGILDKAKGALSKAQELAVEHSDQVKHGIDKAEELANKATKGKYAEKIEAIGEKAAAKVPTKTTEEAGSAPTAAAEPEPTDDQAPPADAT